MPKGSKKRMKALQLRSAHLCAYAILSLTKVKTRAPREP